MGRTYRVSLFFLALVSLISTSAFAETFTTSVQSAGAKDVKYYRVNEQGTHEISGKDYIDIKIQGLSETFTPAALYRFPLAVDQAQGGFWDYFKNPIFPWTQWYEYIEDMASRGICPELRVRVSKAVYNATPNMANFSVGYAHTQGYSITGSVSGTFSGGYSGEFGTFTGAVTSGVSFTWSESATASETATLQVSPNKYGWWEFEPIMNKSVGRMIKHLGLHRILTNEYLTVLVPHTIYARLDGILIAMESDGAPAEIMQSKPADLMKAGAEDYQLVDRWGGFGTADGKLKSACYMNTDAAGNVYVADTENHRVQKFTAEGDFLMKIGSYGVFDGQFKRPTGVAVDAAGNIYVGDQENYRIQKFSPTGAFQKKWGNQGEGNGQFTRIKSMHVGPDGNLYVLDYVYSKKVRVQVFTTNGDFLRSFNLPVDREVGEYMAMDTAGNLYFTYGPYTVMKYSPSGTFMMSFGELGFLGGLCNVSSVGVDRNGDIYVGNNPFLRSEIQKYSSTGTYITRWNGGLFNPVLAPRTILADAQGMIYVADDVRREILVFAKGRGTAPEATPTTAPTASPVVEASTGSDANRGGCTAALAHPLALVLFIPLFLTKRR